MTNTTPQYEINEKNNIGEEILTKLQSIQQYPVDTDSIPKGDMPEEKVVIGPDNMKKSQMIFPTLLEYIIPILSENPYGRVVVAVCGGSGVGKSGISSMISYYLNNMNIGSYTLSGDNYPRRMPKYNDAERLHIFRENGIKGLIANGLYSKEKDLIIRELQKNGDDANSAYAKIYPWLEVYQSAGYDGLKNYIGTLSEINFDELTGIISQFKNGKHQIFLKRMGRLETQLWYDLVDFSDKNVMVIDWTHGNSHSLQGVDIPILLSSTPEETLEQRKARNRDTGTDSWFTNLVLKIEQELLISQAAKAKLIVAQSGEIISYNDFINIMMQNKQREI